MSRSRIDYDKGRRDQLGREAIHEFAQEQAVAGDPPELLVQASKGEKLKPSLYSVARNKGISTELFQSVFNLIRHSKVYVFAEEKRADGKTWWECRMQIRHDHEANVNNEQFQFLLNHFAERHDLVGQFWDFYFWFPSPQPEMNE